MLTEVDAKSIPGFSNHEKVYKCDDQESGLLAYIAIHNTRFGPATGGTRWLQYDNEIEALTDVLKLSEAMTYKCSLAGVRFGGGKAVIYSEGSNIDRKEILKAYGRAVDELNGRFTTGTDVGVTDKDTHIMATESCYVLGQPVAGMKKFNTSAMAAFGVYIALRTAYKHVYNKENLKDSRIAIKGIGKLGRELVELLLKDGAEVVVAENNLIKVKEFHKSYPDIQIVDSKNIHKEVVDIYSPCALGGEFTLKNIKEIKAKIIAGGANNQLQSSAVGDELHNLGIIYLPDYVVNAGGLVGIVDELEEGGYQAERVQQRIRNISKTLLEIIQKSEESDKPTYCIANTLAEKIFLNKKI